MMRSGRVGPLNSGLADIRTWRESDEVHLPVGQTPRVPFLPEQRPLDAILRRETLEERLVGFVVPERISPELGEPGAIARAREELHQTFARLAGSTPAGTRNVLQAAADLLARETVLHEEIRTALAALLRA
ncbi:MAG: hypothetical protein O9328_05445 [Rhodobacteraceae bacterium]|nr:hypothetical protein [Paracoccaceae bacterium]